MQIVFYAGFVFIIIFIIIYYTVKLALSSHATMFITYAVKLDKTPKLKIFNSYNNL